MSTGPAPGLGPVASPPRHTPVEDAIAFASATVLVALGLALFEHRSLITGGTAGLALLLSYRFPIDFGLAFVLVNLPFFALALTRMGWRFTLKSSAAVLLVAGASELQRPLLVLGEVNPFYASATGGLLVGVGLLILIRHRGSLGGFNVLALYLQDRLGWRAGWVQLALDGAVVLLSAATLAPSLLAVSLIGALTLNLTLAINHRPGRYVGL